MKKHGHRERLVRLTEELVEDVLRASEKEVLSESDADFETVTAQADHVRALLDKALINVAKKRLLAAREAVDQRKEQWKAKVFQLNPLQARRKLDALLHEHPEATKEFTLAARKGSDLSDADILNMLEDLQELGLYDPETDPETDK
jgi:CO/xanthine dehydrogenase Mo-binding subunit